MHTATWLQVSGASLSYHDMALDRMRAWSSARTVVQSILLACLVQQQALLCQARPAPHATSGSSQAARTSATGHNASEHEGSATIAMSNAFGALHAAAHLAFYYAEHMPRMQLPQVFRAVDPCCGCCCFNNLQHPTV